MGPGELALPMSASRLNGPDDLSGIIRAARAGDLGAFEALMRRHERLVLGTALRLLGSLEDAQDASQEVFLRLFRNLKRFDESGSLPAWLYRVTVNVCHDVRRKRPVAEPLEEAAGLSTAPVEPPERFLELALRRLPEKERAALVLRDLEGLTTRQVAEALGSSETTVRSQISTARLKIREFAARYLRRRS